MPLFYNHESDEEISVKLQTKELANWIEHLEFVTTEINHLLKLKKELVINKILEKELLDKKEENEVLLSIFYNYRSKVENSIECMDIACDMYYLNQQEIFREQYLFYVREYRALKAEILA